LSGFDVARVRGLYPTVAAGAAHLDGSFSTLYPESVIRAIVATLRSTPSQPGSRSERSLRSGRVVSQARRAMGDLVGASPDAVVLADSLATLVQRFATLLGRDWQLGDEIVLSRVDSDISLRSWLAAARATGVIVRWAEVDLETGELPSWQYEQLINHRTRLVTVPLANPATGTVPDVRWIADLAHRYGALTVVDAGAAVPHLPIDMGSLGADLMGVSTTTFGGPTVAAFAARAGLLLEMEENVERAVPEHFEVGPLPIELMPGVTAAVDHLASLDETAQGTRRERLAASIAAAGEYEAKLYRHLDDGLRSTPGVFVLGDSAERLPVAAFTVDGKHPAEVGDFLQRHGISVWTGQTGMSALMTAMGADELGGAVFVGLMPHTTLAEVDQLLGALRELSR
jgi:cysteine desulfurase family protein (TIGR01976 family)